MKDELFSMYQYPSMIKSAAFCAALFAFLSVVLKTSFVLIPEVSEVRVCNILACSCGIWFGPAGAWGCAVGNLIGDLGGSLTILSLSGFWGNFFSAWLPYKVWTVWGSVIGEDPLERPSLQSKNWLIRYLVGGFCSVVSCSALLAVTFDCSGDMAAVNSFAMVFLNNAGATIVGIALFALMCRLPENVLRYWRSQMRQERDLVFPAAHKGKIRLVVGLSAAVTVFVAVYMLLRGIGLTVHDDLFQPLPLAVCVGYTIAQAVLTALCRWRRAERTEIAEVKEILLD